MKTRVLSVTSLLLALSLAAPGAQAGPQQERMKRCNAEAKAQNLKGPDRSGFMKNCLSNKGNDAANNPAPGQQEKMKACNQEARDKGLKGTERRSFMGTCLKK